MANVIVSDAGPIITLEKMSDGYDFIRSLYEKIIIPSAVLKEVAEREFSDPLDYLETKIPQMQNCYRKSRIIQTSEKIFLMNIRRNLVMAKCWFCQTSICKYMAHGYFIESRFCSVKIL